VNLRVQAEADLRAILHDAGGFSWPIRVIDPDGRQAQLQGFANDVAVSLDPETGIPVANRKATVAIAIRDLLEANLEIPKGIADGEKGAWVVEFNDINGRPTTAKISDAMPDRGLGIVTCTLEAFRRS
jgi:hypothetical protein